MFLTHRIGKGISPMYGGWQLIMQLRDQLLFSADFMFAHPLLGRRSKYHGCKESAQQYDKRLKLRTLSTDVLANVLRPWSNKTRIS